MESLKLKFACVTLVGSAFCTPAMARNFAVELDTLKPSLVLPLTTRDEDVAPTFEQVRKRVEASQVDPRVEPLYLSVPVDDDERAAFALNLARAKKYRALTALMDKEVERVQRQQARPAGNNNNANPNNAISLNQNDDRARFVRIVMRPDLVDLLSPQVVTARLKRKHVDVVIDSTRLVSQPESFTGLLTQLAPFNPAADLKKLADKMRMGIPVDVDAEILPAGARRAVKTFEFYRGPNCFMTALAFQYPRMVRSQMVNIRAEENHHEVMINNDELWRVLQSSFYEVDPDRTELKFGDMLVFFQLPGRGKIPPDSEISYRWLKHATTYLFNGLVYSKGSKSPNSPYVVAHLREEWKGWQKHLANSGGLLGVKVFRKPLKSATSRPPKSLDDWMY